MCGTRETLAQSSKTLSVFFDTADDYFMFYWISV